MLNDTIGISGWDTTDLYDEDATKCLERLNT